MHDGTVIEMLHWLLFGAFRSGATGRGNSLASQTVDTLNRHGELEIEPDVAPS